MASSHSPKEIFLSISEVINDPEIVSLLCAFYSTEIKSY